MPYHEWGDEDFDWNALYAAERWIVTWSRRLALLNIISKEKYGTIRWEHYLSLYQGCYYRPVFVPKRLGNWLWHHSSFHRWFVFKKFFMGIRLSIFLIIVWIATKKYPQVREELIADLEDGFIGLPDAVLKRLFK